MLCRHTSTWEKQPVLQLWGTADLKRVRTEQVPAHRCPLPCKHPQAVAWQPAAAENFGAAAGPVAHLQLHGDVGASGTPVKVNSQCGHWSKPADRSSVSAPRR